MAAPGHHFDHASLVTTSVHGDWHALDALWLAHCALFCACACKRSPPTAATCHNPRPITHDPSLALTDAGAAAASPVKSRPKQHSARVCLSPSQTASCARPRAWSSAGVDAAPCPLALEPLVNVRRVSRALRRRHIPPLFRLYKATPPPLLATHHSTPPPRTRRRAEAWSGRPLAVAPTRGLRRSPQASCRSPGPLKLKQLLGQGLGGLLELPGPRQALGAASSHRLPPLRRTPSATEACELDCDQLHPPFAKPRVRAGAPRAPLPIYPSSLAPNHLVTGMSSGEAAPPL